MRPRKNILIVGEDEDACGRLRYLLDTQNAYRATTAISARQALILLKDCRYELMLLVSPLASISVLLCRAKTADDSMPTIVLMETRPPYGEIGADMMLWKPSMADLFERIKVMSMRKRGPKKGFRKPVEAETFILEVAEVA